jgi:hypothetical protein
MIRSLDINKYLNKVKSDIPIPTKQNPLNTDKGLYRITISKSVSKPCDVKEISLDDICKKSIKKTSVKSDKDTLKKLNSLSKQNSKRIMEVPKNNSYNPPKKLPNNLFIDSNGDVRKFKILRLSND